MHSVFVSLKMGLSPKLVFLVSIFVLLLVAGPDFCRGAEDSKSGKGKDKEWNPEAAFAPRRINLNSNNYRSKKEQIDKAIRKQKKNWVAAVNPDFENQNLSDFRVLLGAEPVAPPPSRGVAGPPPAPPPEAPPGLSEAPKPRPAKRRRFPPKRGNGTESTKGQGRSKRAINLPTKYDVRTDYPECTSIDSIRKQYRCSSCYAVQATSAMSDRHCIYNYHKTGQIFISSYHVLSCVPKGCNGGKEWDVFDFWIKNGIVSGGTAYKEAKEPDGCLPYPDALSQTPTSCATTCSASNYPKTFDKDKTYGGDYETMWYPTVEQIQKEIWYYGPVVAFFTVYEDFTQYKAGVYEYVYGGLVGYHNAKLIGWGTEGGVDYWLAVNSWGVNWGQAGLFKIRRGANTVGIEQRVSWVLPKEAVPS